VLMPVWEEKQSEIDWFVLNNWGNYFSDPEILVDTSVFKSENRAFKLNHTRGRKREIELVLSPRGGGIKYRISDETV